MGIQPFWAYPALDLRDLIEVLVKWSQIIISQESIRKDIVLNICNAVRIIEIRVIRNIDNRSVIVLEKDIPISQVSRIGVIESCHVIPCVYWGASCDFAILNPVRLRSVDAEMFVCIDKAGVHFVGSGAAIDA